MKRRRRGRLTRAPCSGTMHPGPRINEPFYDKGLRFCRCYSVYPRLPLRAHGEWWMLRMEVW